MGTKTVYTFSHGERVCNGHGDYSDEDRIKRMGPYGTGEFPPVFEDKIEALEWIEQQTKWFGGKLVELTLVTSSRSGPERLEW